MKITATIPVHVGGAWIQPGEDVPYPARGYDYERALRRGHITSEDEVTNPVFDDPASAGGEATPAPDGDLPRLLGLLDVDTADEFEERFTAMQAAANQAAEYARQLDEGAGKVAGLEARLAALGALHAAEGEALPTNFNRRSQLDALGLTTWESLRGKTVKQLSAIEGITDEQAGQIVTKVDAHFAPAE